MAGLTITVGGNDITAYVDVNSIIIEEVGTEVVAKCKFQARDHSGTVSISSKDTIDIDDDGTTIYAGEVAEVREDQEGIAKLWKVVGQDYNVFLDEVVVESESYAAGVSDAYILGNATYGLFPQYRSDIDAVTYVATLDASMEAVSFAAMTLREILDDLAQRTGARYYVDYDKNLHWFDTESNPAGFSLSTSPNMSSSFPFGGFKCIHNGAQLVDYVFVLGKEVSGWVGGTPSYVPGERMAVSRDQRITTAQGVTDRGNAIIGRYGSERVTYELWTENDGLRAGMSITLVNATWGIDSSFYIRKLRTEFIGKDGELRRHRLWLDDEPPDPSRKARHMRLAVATLQTELNSIGDFVFDTDAPSAPTLAGGNLTTGVDVDADGHQIVYLQVTWGVVADTDLDHYTVQVSTSSDFSAYTISRDHAAGGDRIERFVGLLGNTLYYVRVRAVDWVGNTSGWSSTQSKTTDKDTTAPAQVAGLSAASSRTVVGLQWTANSEADLAYYEIQRAPDVSGSPGTYAEIAKAHLNFYVDQDFTDGEISGGDTFWYRVRATDTSGNQGTWATQTSVALDQIGTDHIAALAITTDLLAANSVTAAKINVSQLSAISADMGTITAGTVTGATIRTAASGARVLLDSSSGLQVYNSSEVLCAQLDVDGSGQLGSSSYEPIVWNSAGELNKLKANQLEIGHMFFSKTDGLVLLTPTCKIGSAAWTSTRGTSATISGAFHREAGHLGDTQALVIEAATTNYALAPRMIDGNSDNRADGWAISESCTGTPTESVGAHPIDERGWMQRIEYTGVSGDSGETIQFYDLTGAGTFAQNDYCSISVDLKGAMSGASVNLRIQEYDASAVAGTAHDDSALTLISQLQRASYTVQMVDSDCSQVGVEIRVSGIDNGDTVDVYFGAVNCENQDHATSFCCGALDWCSWSGTEDASTSTRTATQLALTNFSDLISGNDTWTLATWVQMPYDADGTWPQQYSFIFDAYHDGSNRVSLAYDSTNDEFVLYINGAYRITNGGTQSFDAGDWVHLAVTLDFSSDEYYTYVDGVVDGSDTTSLTASTVTTWTVGHDYSGASNWGNFTVDEIAVLDRILTDEEIGQLYILHCPVVDAGAFEGPGVYIFNGRFYLATSLSDARIELDETGLFVTDEDGDAALGVALTDSLSWGGFTVNKGDIVLGHNKASMSAILWDRSAGTFGFYGNASGTVQVEIATDGSLTAGAGNVVLDSSGIDITGSLSIATAGSGARIEFDTDGFYMWDGSGDSVIGLSLTDTVSWAGFTIDTGDMVLGHNKASMSAILWDRSAGTFGFYGNASGTVQVEIATDGSLTAGAGAVVLDSSGIDIIGSLSIATAGSGARIEFDTTGFYMNDADGYGVIGLSLTDSKSWGGFTIDTGDMVLGHNRSGMAAIKWDRSAGKFGFYGGAGSVQVEINTDGSLTAGGGNVVLDSSGITIDGSLSIGTAASGIRIELDTSGLFCWDGGGDAVLGVALSGTSWGGFSLSAGDVVLGHNKSGKSAIKWDESAGKFGFYGGGSGTVQVEIDTDGSLTAGAGAVTLDSSGIDIVGSLSIATAGSGARIEFDTDGFFMWDGGGDAVLGMALGSTSWGGFSLATGDMVIGHNKSGKSAVRWDESTGKLGFYGGGSGTVQVEIDTDGTLTAGAGNIVLGDSGMKITPATSDTYNEQRAVEWYEDSDEWTRFWGWSSGTNVGQYLDICCPSGGISYFRVHLWKGGSPGAPDMWFVYDSDPYFEIADANVLVDSGGLSVSSATPTTPTDGEVRCEEIRVGEGIYVGSVGTSPTSECIHYEGNLKSVKSSTHDVYAFKPLTTPLTHSSFNGDSFSDVTSSTIIQNTSWSSTIPTDAKALLLALDVRDSATWGTADLRFEIGPTSTYYYALTARPAGGDVWITNTAAVPCTSGDVYYRCNASGSSTLEVYLRCWGYWI